MRRNQAPDLFDDFITGKPLHIHRIDFLDEIIPRTRANIPDPRLNLSQLALIKEL